MPTRKCLYSNNNPYNNRSFISTIDSNYNNKNIQFELHEISLFYSFVISHNMTDLFTVQRQCLRLMGHKFRSRNADKSTNRFRWHTIIYLAALVLVVSAQGPMMNYVVYYIDDLTLATASLSICLTNVLTAIKITTFLLCKRKFVMLMLESEDMFDKLHELAAKRVLKDANRTATRLVKVYFWSVSCTGLYFMMGPLLKIIWSALGSKPIKLDLPMPMRFPFDYESPPGYAVGYVYTGLVTYTVVMYASAIDGLFLSFTINLRAHFQLLQRYIRRADFRRAESSQVHRKLCDLIRYHEKLLHLSQTVRELYVPIVFAQFLMTSLQVCVIVYQMVTHMNSVMVLMVYCTFLGSIMIQLFIYCYGGEILKSESLLVGIAVQRSAWYNLAPAQRRMLCLMLQRSQREAVIKAGFYEASLANFMLILKAAASYITLIQSIE